MLGTAMKTMLEAARGNNVNVDDHQKDYDEKSINVDDDHEDYDEDIGIFHSVRALMASFRYTMVAEIALDAWKKSPGHNAVSLIRILGTHCCFIVNIRYTLLDVGLTDLSGDC